MFGQKTLESLGLILVREQVTQETLATEQLRIAPSGITDNIHIQLARRSYRYIHKPCPLKKMLETKQGKEIDVVRGRDLSGFLPQDLQIEAINTQGANENIAAWPHKALEHPHKLQRLPGLYRKIFLKKKKRKVSLTTFYLVCLAQPSLISRIWSQYSSNFVL